MYNRKIYKIKGTVYTVPFSQAVCSLRKIEVGNFLDSVKLQSKAYKTFDRTLPCLRLLLQIPSHV